MAIAGKVHNSSVGYRAWDFSSYFPYPLATKQCQHLLFTANGQTWFSF